MRNFVPVYVRCCAFAAALAVFLSCVGAGAQTFVLDTNQSVISISGSVAGATLSEQAPGSLTTHYEGTLQATVSGGNIQFTGGSLIEALTNGSWQPNADGSAGSQPADYGGQGSTGLATGKAALRQIELDATSPPVAVSGGQFDSRSITFQFPSGAPSSLAYNISGFINSSGAKALNGYATNAVTTQATLSLAGGRQTLTLPVDATFFFTLLSANDTSIRLQGQFVATDQSAAPLVVQTPVVSNQSVKLNWQSAPNQDFVVLSSTNLVTWQTNASNVTSTTSNYTWTGSATAPSQFFRLAK